MDNAKIQSQFAEDGFVRCPKFFDDNEIQEILSYLDQFIKDRIERLPREHVFFEDRNDPLSLKQLQRLQEHDAYFADVMRGKPKKLAEILLRGPVASINMQYFNKPPRTGQPTPAHQDGFYFKLEPCEALTMWLALEDVDEENGCVRYVPGSHRQGLRPHSQTETLGFSQGIIDYPSKQDREKEIAIPASPGDLLAHHALTIHRADGNQSQSRTRRALGFIFYDVKAKQDEAAYQKYQANLAEKLVVDQKI